MSACEELYIPKLANTLASPCTIKSNILQSAVPLVRKRLISAALSSCPEITETLMNTTRSDSSTVYASGSNPIVTTGNEGP